MLKFEQLLYHVNVKTSCVADQGEQQLENCSEATESRETKSGIFSFEQEWQYVVL